MNDTNNKGFIKKEEIGFKCDFEEVQCGKCEVNDEIGGKCEVANDKCDFAEKTDEVIYNPVFLQDLNRSSKCDTPSGNVSKSKRRLFLLLLIIFGALGLLCPLIIYVMSSTSRYGMFYDNVGYDDYNHSTEGTLDESIYINNNDGNIINDKSGYYQSEDVIENNTYHEPNVVNQVEVSKINNTNESVVSNHSNSNIVIYGNGSNVVVEDGWVIINGEKIYNITYDNSNLEIRVNGDNIYIEETSGNMLKTYTKTISRNVSYEY